MTADVLDLSPYLLRSGDRVRRQRLRRELARHACSTADARNWHAARMRMIGGEA